MTEPVDLRSLTIAELAAHIQAMKDEINSAGCSPCARARLDGVMKSARRRMTQLRRDKIIADAQAAQAARAEQAAGPDSGD